ncbi:unnamed protein product [Meganyctiphanes norvegica]|uniref:NACHT domain-containing protein n=1 Tax=Meganyctiphanes norvegica TaxID=48144 RepID=A0AAV2S9B2_MEGNR
MTESQYKDNFDGTMRRVIEDSPASGEEYDISLLIKCLRVLSYYYDRDSKKKWRNDIELESKCQKLATKRNDIFHSFAGIDYLNMKKEIEEIELLINDIFSTLKLRFPSEVSEISIKNKEINDQIKDILKQPLAEQDIKFYRCQMILRGQIVSYKNRCKSFGKIKILKFLTDSNNLHNVKLIFTEIIIEKSNRFNKNTPVKYTDIMSLVSEYGILLLDSEAGGGKSTTVNFGVDDWTEGGKEMNTTRFIFIFPMMFKNPYLSTVGDLIGELLPEVKAKMGNDDIMNCLADPSLNILFLCDGYDERNEKSTKLFNEICTLKEKHKHIKVIVTSRPEAVQELYNTCGSRLKIDHLKIKGIHESKRKEFLKKYHDEMINSGDSKESTEDLLNFYESCSAQHKDLYRLPINLTMLSWLWGRNPKLVKSIKSAAGLYDAILNMLKDKLVNRVLTNPDVMSQINFTFITELINLIVSFECKVFNASLDALKSDRMFIDKIGVDSMRNVCRDKGVPFSELQGAFLLVTLQWNIKLQAHLEIPHKGFLDFYAAKCIESKITREGNKIKDILLELYGKDHKEYMKNINKYQNVLQLLGGILALRDPSLVEQYGQEIIKLLIKTGIRNNKQWYTVYCDFNISPTAAEKFANLIAPHLDLKDFIIKDSDVDILSTLLKYVNVKSLTMDITSSVNLVQLSALMDTLSIQKCAIKIANKDLNNFTISDDDVKAHSILLKYVNVQSVKLDISSAADLPQLPSLINVLRNNKCFININDLTIKDADVEVLSTLLEYTNVQSVILDISSAADLPQLPTLINVLRNNKCFVNINDLTIKDADIEVLSTLPKYTNVQSVTMDICSSVNLVQLIALMEVLKSKKYMIKIANKDLNNFTINDAECFININDITIKDTDMEVLSTFLKYINVQSVTMDISSSVNLVQLITLIEVLKIKKIMIKIAKKDLNDAEVEALLTLLKYTNAQSVTIDINTTAMIPQLPSLIDVLRSKICTINILKITGNTLLWISSINKKAINASIQSVVIDSKLDLSFLCFGKSIETCRL